MPRTPRSLSAAEALLLGLGGAFLIALPALTGGVWLAIVTCVLLVVVNWRHWRIRPRVRPTTTRNANLLPQVESRAPKRTLRRVENESVQPLEVI